MSGRTVPRFALAGLLAAALAAPAVAQQAEGGFQPPLNSGPTIPVPNTALPEAPMPRAKDVLADNDFLLSYYAASFAYLSDIVTADDAPKAEPVQPMAPPRPLEVAAPAPCCDAAGTKPQQPVMTSPVANANEGIRVEVQEARTGSFVVGNFDINPDALPLGYHLELGYKLDPHAVLASTMVAAVPPCCGTNYGKSTVAVTDQKIDPVARVNSPRVIRTRVHLAASLLDEQQFAAPPRSSDSATAPVVPVCGGIPQPQVFAFGEAAQIQLVFVDELPPAPDAPPKPAASPLLGTWYRNLGADMGVIAVTFTPNEMKLCLTQREGNNNATITVTAHYTATKDGLVFGAVTGADVDTKLDSQTQVGMELAEVSLMLQELADRPFSFRTKMTSAGMMVSQVKAASGDQIRGQEFAAFGGLYKFAKDGRVPAPTAKAPSTIGIRAEPAPRLEFISPAPPVMREPVQRIGVDFNISAPVVAPQTRPIYRVEVVEQPLLPNFGLSAPPVGQAVVPPVPIVCNDPTKGLAADAFGQLLQQGGVQRPDGAFVDNLPKPRPAAGCTWGPAADAQFVVAPQPIFAVGAPIVKPVHIGTWYRDIGTKRCVVKIEADHLTVTLSEAQDSDGETVTGNLVFTADYQLTRDGMTAVGLVTSVDTKFDGDVSDDDMKSVMDMVTELQKAMEEKPFAMTFRRYGEALVIGHVRMPEVGNSMELQPATYIGGRYKAVGDKPLSALKAVKPREPKPAPVGLPPLPPPPGAFGPPPGVYGMPYSPAPRGNVVPVPYAVYPPPVGASPNDLLPPQAVPCPAPPRPVEYQAPPVPATRPTLMTVPVPQSEEVPTMPAPRPMSAPAALPECSPTMSVPQPVTLEIAPAPHAPMIVRSKNDSGQYFNFSVGVFGSQ